MRTSSRSVGRWTTVLTSALVWLIACGRPGEALRQPVGQTTVTSGAPQRDTTDGYVPPAIDLYLARRAPGPCGMDRPPPVMFDFASSTIEPSEDLELRSLAQCLTASQFHEAELVLVGHADPIGSSTYNLDLAYDRAARVRARLIELGIPAGRLVITSAGEARLPRERWDEARRVDVVIVRPGAASRLPAR